MTREEWQEKIRNAILLGNEKGLRTETIGMSTGHWVHLPDGSKKRFPGASRLIKFLEEYKRP